VFFAPFAAFTRAASQLGTALTPLQHEPLRDGRRHLDASLKLTYHRKHVPIANISSLMLSREIIAAYSVNRRASYLKTWIQEVLVQISAVTLTILIRDFRGFSQSLQSNHGWISVIIQRSLPSISFPNCLLSRHSTLYSLRCLQCH
jgi:hypothetical protein